MFTPKLSWDASHEKLRTHAQKAIFAIYNYKISFGYFPIKKLFILFDSMIKPILCYGSQIWGYEYIDSIEVVHNKFCKRILCVKKSTNTCLVHGECGRLPLCVTYLVNFIKYWCKLLIMPNH